MHNRWKCRDCDHICTNAEILTAPNPFADTAEVTGCPNCKAVESLSAACAIEGCKRDGTCGGPGADDVYRSTCYEHADWLHKKDAAGVETVDGWDFVVAWSEQRKAAAGVEAPAKPGWLSESFGKFLREQKGYTDEQIAAECKANGLLPPAGVPPTPATEPKGGA